jgi:hypothetical protein
MEYALVDTSMKKKIKGGTQMIIRKHIAKLVTAIFLLTFLNTAAFAATGDEINAGITPDSILYPVDKAIENVQVALTTDPVEKAQTLTEISSERLDEAQVMASEGKTELVSTAITESQNTQAEAQNVLTSAEKNFDTENVTAEQTQALDNAVTEMQKETNDQMKQLETIVETAPEEVKEEVKAVVDQAQIVQLTRQESVKAFVEARHNVNSTRKEVRMITVEMNKVSKTDDTAKVTELQTKLNEATNKYNESVKKMVEAKDVKQKAVKSQVSNTESKVETDNAAATIGTDQTSTTIEQNNTQDVNAAEQQKKVDNVENVENSTTEETKSVKSPNENADFGQQKKSENGKKK